MMQLRSVFLAVKLVLCVLWPVSALAAQVTYELGMASMPLMSVLMTLVISSLSGLTALLHQMRKELMDKGEIKHLKLYVASKMLGSNVAGVLFLFISANKVEPNWQVGVIIVASFGGTWILERVLSWGADKFFPAKG